MMKKKPVQPKICPHCGKKFYALFSHMDSCTGARRTINDAVKAALKMARQQTKY